MDTKEYAGWAVFFVAIVYVLACAARRGTRYEAKGLEWALVALLLLGAAILLPVIFGSV